MRPFRIFFAALFAVFLLPLVVQAHALNQSYIYFQVAEDGLTGRFEVTLPDIDQVVPLDANGDGFLSAEEFQARADDVFAVLSDALTLQQNGQNLSISLTGTDTFGGGVVVNRALFAQLEFDVEGLEGQPEALQMGYVFLYDGIDPTHTGYALIEENFRTGISENERFVSLIFDAGSGIKDLSLVGQSAWSVFLDFVIHGVWHIWIGFDHILFLVSLLLPAVMILVGRHWEPRDSFGDAFWSVLKIVTLFTIAHTITLSLAALGVLNIPAPLIEFVIAISIAIMALDNIYPIFHRRTWMVILGFGLIHGFGFANVLAPLGIDPQHTVLTLASFNIGVELGQAAIVAVLFPVLFLIRKQPFYVPVVMKGVSVILIAIALFWAMERAPALIEGFGRISERGTLTPG